MTTATTADARRVRRRRALGLVAMSAVLPGSAQFVAGNRTVGRVALRVWAVVWLLAVALLVSLLLVRGPALAMLLNGAVLSVLRVGAWVVLIGWTALLLDAWRLTRPGQLTRGTRLALTASCLALAVVAGVSTNVVASALTAADNVSSVLRGGGDRADNQGRYNILLLGVDAADDRVGIRPDSINVASVDAGTGRTVLFGLPRNLEGAPFPETSPLHAMYPDGFRCENSECMLNGVHTLASDNADLYPGRDAGLAATREVVEETLGLDINYYAMVDMAGFQDLIDAMGGITLNSSREVPIGGGGSAVSGYIEQGDGIRLDGYHALWYARSRHDSSDYERMARQKCVMAAMAKQLDPFVVATKFVALSEAGKDLVVTDVGAGHVAELADLALRAKSLDITTVDFTPPLIATNDPDLALIRSTVEASIAEAEMLDANGSTSPAPAQPSTAAPHPAGSAEAADESAGPTTAATSASATDAASTEPTPTPEPTPICSVS